MKIELRKLKLNRHLSEETNCYSAELWIDDRKAFLAGNHGHGGPDHYHQVGSWNETEVDAWLKANRPMISVQGIALEPSLELEVGDLIEEHEQTAALRRKSRTNLLSIEDGQVFSRPLKGRDPKALGDALRRSHPGIVILESGNVEAFREAARLMIADARRADTGR
jgi:hypothetical protein